MNENNTIQNGYRLILKDISLWREEKGKSPETYRQYNKIG